MMHGGNGSWDASLKRHDRSTWSPSFDDDEPGGRFIGGLSLASKSWQVIRADRSLLVLPVLQVVFQIIAMAAVLAPIGYDAYGHASRWTLLIGFAAVAFPLNFLSTFFGVAFVFVLRANLDGRRTSVGEAVRFAGSRLDAITGWALLSTAVSIAIQALERVRGGGIAARIAGWLLGATWTIATLFVLPALAAERIGPIAAARKSARVIKLKWGEGIVGTTAIGIAFGLWMIPVAIVGGIGFAAFSTAPVVGVSLIAVAVTGFVLLSAAQAAVDGVFRFVLFDYAENGTIHAPFTEGNLEYGLRRRKRRWFGLAR